MRQGGKSLCTFNDPMSSPSRMMCPILNPLLLGLSSKLRTNEAKDCEVLQNVTLVIGANFIGDGLFV